MKIKSLLVFSSLGVADTAGSLRSPLPRQASKNDENEGRSAIFACLSFLAWDEPRRAELEKNEEQKKGQHLLSPSFFVV
jgi:hypothetical protein